jgi:hypothetical protein
MICRLAGIFGCAHPHCLTLFLATRSDERYREQHRADHNATARARQRHGKAKLERVRLYPLGGQSLQIGIRASDSGDEHQLTITGDGHQPSDEDALLELLRCVSLELLHVGWADELPPA